jgi:hypothetical protein
MTDGNGGIETARRRRSRRVEDDATRRTALLGILSAGAALATIMLLWAGISFALSDRYLVSTDVAYLATGTSVAAVVGGASAMVLGRGRAWGAVAIVFGVLASPLVLTRILGWASGLG